MPALELHQALVHQVKGHQPQSLAKPAQALQSLMICSHQQAQQDRPSKVQFQAQLLHHCHQQLWQDLHKDYKVALIAAPVRYQDSVCLPSCQNATVAS
mmetsp:Transcript_72246/g.159527  ORF Transcript_72246/g.159527 Transcript_72246/m.159527 type:complete len:98 (-) Transcript_72246:522-815(-)